MFHSQEDMPYLISSWAYVSIIILHLCLLSLANSPSPFPPLHEVTFPFPFQKWISTENSSMKPCLVFKKKVIFPGFSFIKKQTVQTLLRKKLYMKFVNKSFVSFLRRGFGFWWVIQNDQVPDLTWCMYACFSWFFISFDAKNSDVKIRTSGKNSTSLSSWCVCVQMLCGVSSPGRLEIHSSTDNNSISARWSWVIDLILWATGFWVAVTASGSPTIQLDSVSLSCNSISFTRACRLIGTWWIIAHTRSRRWWACTTVIGDGWTDRRRWWSWKIVVVVVVLFHSGGTKACCKFVDGWASGIVGFEYEFGGVWRQGFMRFALGNGEGTTLGDIDAKVWVAARFPSGRWMWGMRWFWAGGLSGWRGTGFAGAWWAGFGWSTWGLFNWNVENIQDAASSWFGSWWYGRVVRDVISINDVVIPISLTRLKSGALKSESTFPATGFWGSLVLSKWKLTGIVIPATK